MFGASRSTAGADRSNTKQLSDWPAGAIEPRSFAAESARRKAGTATFDRSDCCRGMNKPTWHRWRPRAWAASTILGPMQRQWSGRADMELDEARQILRNVRAVDVAAALNFPRDIYRNVL